MTAPGPVPLLDWRHPGHWSWTPRPCRYCGHDTHLRDTRRNPACKTCAEHALAQQAAEAADTHTLTTRKDTA